MSLRRSRKRGAVQKVTALWASSKVAQKTAPKAAKQVAKRAPGRKPLAVIGGALALVALVAAVRKRRAAQGDLPYGPPNESVPSHETLAPAKEAAGQEAPDPNAANTT